MHAVTFISCRYAQSPLLLAGAGGSSTLIALGTDAAVEAFCSGKAVLGDDFSLSLGAAPNPT
jgi:hypothetical protein